MRKSHRKFLALFFLLLVGSLAVVGICGADSWSNKSPSAKSRSSQSPVTNSKGEPEVFVREVLDRLIASKNPAIVMDYIHWNSAYAGLSDTKRRELGVSSPEELERFFEKYFANPEKAFFERHAQIDYHATENGSKEKILKDWGEIIRRKRAHIEDRLTRARYDVTLNSINHPSALVEIKSTLDGRTKTQEIPLQWIDGKWYLPSLKLFSKESD